MKNKDIMDEDYGKKVSVEESKTFNAVASIFAITIASCIGTVLIVLCFKLCKWILGI